MKARNVLDKEKCETRYQYGGLEGEKGKPYWNGVVIREVFRLHGLKYTAKNIEDVVDSVVPHGTFHTSREEILNRVLLAKKLIRFQEHMNNNVLSPKSVIIGSGSAKIINNINVEYTFIEKVDNFVNIYKVKNKKNNEWKDGGRSIFTKTSESMELYLLQLAGEALYPNAYVMPKIAYLSHQKDKQDNLVSTLEYGSKKDTIVSNHFNSVSRRKMDERLNDIINDNVQCHQEDCTSCPYNDICNYLNEEVKLKVISAKPKTAGKVKFTKHQMKVMNIKSGTYRVLAGAGSGKTTCIANRIVELVKNNVNLKDILLITFTTKGVSEMKEKIEYWLKMNNIPFDKKDMKIYTFNSFGQELINQEYSKLGFTAEPILFEKSENLDLIKTILDKNPEIKRYDYVNPFLDMTYAKGAVYKAAEDFAILKKYEASYTEEVESYLDETSEVADDVLNMYNEYSKYMKDNNLIDYDDQVQLSYELLRDPNIVKKYGFEHIICDEFQDSNLLQINILKQLASYPYNESVMVVGDDSQSIYSWRGANSANILNFHKYFPSTVDVQLVENFRSTDEICKLANKINNINHSVIKKNIVGITHGDNPKLKVGNVEELANKVVKDINANNIDYSDIAIIARNKSALLKARDILIKNNIPVYLSVSELLVDNHSVKHIVDFVKFLIDNELVLFFAKYLQVLDQKEFDKHKSSALFYKYLDEEKDKFLTDYNAATDQLAFVYDKLEHIATTNRAIESLLTIIKEKEFQSVEELSRFLNNMMLYKSDYVIEKTDDPVDAVTLTTAHSSKGKEWKHVYLDLDQFKYPNTADYHKMIHDPKVEEERRLLFVAITRAKESLFMMGSPGSAFKEIENFL